MTRLAHFRWDMHTISLYWETLNLILRGTFIPNITNPILASQEAFTDFPPLHTPVSVYCFLIWRNLFASLHTNRNYRTKNGTEDRTQLKIAISLFSPHNVFFFRKLVSISQGRIIVSTGQKWIPVSATSIFSTNLQYICRLWIYIPPGRLLCLTLIYTVNNLFI